jgi:hypothetical protein
MKVFWTKQRKEIDSREISSQSPESESIEAGFSFVIVQGSDSDPEPDPE